MSNSNNVPKLYRSVIEEVIKNVKEAFLNEGVDEQVLQELKQIWENKLLQSRAVDGMPAENQQTRQQYMYPHIVQPNPALPATSTIARPQQRVAITHASTVPVPITHRPGTAGQTAIMFPESRPQAQTHVHALSQMTAAASAATLALPGIQQVQNIQQVQRPTGTQVPAAYPTARTIQVTHSQHQQLQQQQQQQQQQSQQQHQQTAQVKTNKPAQMIIQVDGVNDSDSDEGDDDFGDDQEDEDNERNVSQELEEEPEPEDDPLNSGDDDSDDGATDLFDTENVVVCQFDKIARSRNKWKFHLKDGIMNLKGRDYVFQKAIGEAEW